MRLHKKWLSSNIWKIEINLAQSSTLEPKLDPFMKSKIKSESAHQELSEYVKKSKRGQKLP